MGLFVNVAFGCLFGVIGSLLSPTLGYAQYSVAIGLVLALLGYVLGGLLTPAQSAATGQSSSGASDFEQEQAKKDAKKAKKQAAERAKKEAAEAAKLAEAAAKAAAKKAEKAEKAKAAKKAAAAPAAEPEEEEEEDAAPKSKGALKKAKAKAKAEAAKKEAEAAAKAAAKKAKKEAKKEAKAEAAPAAAPSAAEAKKAAAAAKDDLDGWETIEPSRSSKAAQARAAAAAALGQSASNKDKSKPIPASERLLTEELILPVKQHALIIGSKGATLQLIQDGSGAKIDMPKRDSNSNKIQITGTPLQVAQAKNAIESLAARGFSNITHPGVLSDDINVEPKDLGLILGANGATLRTIQSKTNTRINLPDKGSTSKKVTIVGQKDDVKAAKAAIKSLVADGFSTLTHEGWVKVEVQFPADKFGILIGPKGQTIKSIQGNTKTRINLPDKNTKSNIVSVVGLPAGVAQAEKEINRLLEPLPPLPDPEEEDLATEDAWGAEHTAQGEDALWE